jgi:peptidoglycan/xylan/chitin deacetylase (PgdA/CDA1 family)
MPDFAAIKEAFRSGHDQRRRGWPNVPPTRRSTQPADLGTALGLSSLRASRLKVWLQAGIRAGHVLLASRPLPSRVALTFHELQADQYTEFRRVIRYFLERGYRSVTAAEHHAPATADEKRLWITFDDNYRGWHDALPLFDELGVKATFFVNSGVFRDVATAREIEAYFRRIEYHGAGKATMTTRELVALHRAGHEIGCHSHSHFDLATLRREAWCSEIRESKAYLEQLLGAEVSSFAWPYGARRNFSPDLHSYCTEVGFRVIAANSPGQLYHCDIDPLNAQRTRWQFMNTFAHNLADITVDGRLFERLTGRSAVG